MKENALKRLLRSNKTAIGTMLQEGSSHAFPLVLADVGFDFLFIDMEHTTYSLETVANLLMITRSTTMTPLVRVADLQYHLIARCLDAGAQGIMVPRVETKEQVEKIVRFSKYPPLGVRGSSTTKGHNEFRSAEVQGFIKKANEENMIIIQIESRTAIENIDSLLSVPGVDAAMLGVNDLAISYGINCNLDDPVLIGAIQKVVDAATKHGVYAGIHIRNLEKLKYWMERGMLLIGYNTDIGFLKAASSEGLKELRSWASKLGKD